MKRFDGKKIVITGGASGIGKAILEAFYKAGARQFAVLGRKLDKMEALALQFKDAEILPIQADVSQPEDILAASQQVKEAWGQVDILVNNAGVVSAGQLEKISDEDIIMQQSINVTGLILMTKHFLPLLKASEEGALINVASGLALIGMPFYAPYAATKAAVSRFSEAMRRELKDWPIQVMTVYPTATDTPMMENAVVGQMDSPELVAERTLEGLRAHAISVILGGEQREKDVKENFEDPTGFDQKVAPRYEAMAERTANHRAM